MPAAIKILHLEDVPTDAMLVRYALEKGGLKFEKRDVDTKEAYTAALTEFKPDIVLSDHSLPDFNSPEALTILKESDLDVPFILITSTISEEFAVSIMQMGAADYILKDRMQRLPNAVLSAIDKYKINAERKKAFDELNRLFNTIDEVFFSRDMVNNRLIQISPACKNMYGYTPEEFLANPEIRKSIIHPDNSGIEEQNRERLRKGETVLSQYKVNHKDKGIRWAESKIIPTLDEHGKLVRIDGVTRDITDRKQAELSLIQSEANLRSVFENTDLSIVLLDNNLKVVSYNSNASRETIRVFGKRLTIGSSALKYFPKKRWPVITGIAQNVKRGETVDYEAIYNISGGGEEWFEVRWTGIFNNGKENLGIILTLKNITERKNADLEREKMTGDLIRRNQDLEQFTYIISHNLRAPVANIKGLTDLLGFYDYTDAECVETIASLGTAVSNLDQVILDLNTILQTGTEVNEMREAVSLPTLVEEISDEIRSVIDKNHASIICDFEEVSELETIKTYLHSIFQNLIVNGIKYRKSEYSPEITIKTRRQADKAVIYFSDNGKGIDLKKFGPHLFGLYKRFDFSVEGKGMGLFMVKMQVEALGGTITARSDLGGGSEFVVELPF
jgi:PAS domain S-box-containing protein